MRTYLLIATVLGLLLAACGGMADVEVAPETSTGDGGSGGSASPGVCASFATKGECCGYWEPELAPSACQWMAPEGDFPGACTGGSDDCASYYGNECGAGHYCYEQNVAITPHAGCQITFAAGETRGICLDE